MTENKSKTKYFLIELIVNCMFFAISAAICANVFAIGHVESEASRDLSIATVETQNIAEIVKYSGGDITKISDLLSATVDSESNLNIYYDDNFVRTDSKQNAVYTISLTFTNVDNILYSHIETIKESESIFELNCSLYTQNL